MIHEISIDIWLCIKRTKTIMKRRKSLLLLTLLLCSSAAAVDKANETKEPVDVDGDDDDILDNDYTSFDDDNISDEDDDILSVVDNAPPDQLLDVLLSNLAEKHADEFDEEQISLMDDMIKHIDEKMDGILEEAYDKARARGDKVDID